MPWTPLDDGFYSHRKVVAAGLEAVGLYCRALSWCGANLTDGHVPASVVREFAGSRTRKLTQQLVEVGLWQAVTDGWRIHGWAERNPPGDVLRARRDAKSSRQRRWRDRQNQTEETQDETRLQGVSAGVSDESCRRVSNASLTRAGSQSQSQSLVTKSCPVPESDARATSGTGPDQETPGQDWFGAVRAARERAGLNTAKWTDHTLRTAFKNAQNSRPDLTRNELERALLTIAVWPDTDVPGRLRHAADKALREATNNGQRSTPVPPLPPTVAERRARGDLGNQP